MTEKTEQKAEIYGNDTGTPIVPAEYLVQNYSQLGLNKIHGYKNISAGRYISDKDLFNRMVEEFSYMNSSKGGKTDKPHYRSLGEFFDQYGFEIKADSPFAPKEMDNALISPLEIHNSNNMHPGHIPLRTDLGLPDLKPTVVGTVKSAGEVNVDGKSVYCVEVDNGKQEKRVYGKELESYFSDKDGKPPLYNVGDTMAIIDDGKDGVDSPTDPGKKLARNRFMFEKIDPKDLDNARKHYAESDRNYANIARHTDDPFDLKKFIKDDTKLGKVVAFADMTLEDFNFARGAYEVLRATTMQEKANFDKLKEEYLKKSQKDGFEPKIADFAVKNGYDIRQGSQLDNDDVKSLPVVSFAHPKPEAENKSENAKVESEVDPQPVDDINKAVDKDVEDPANNTIKAGKNHAPIVGGGAILPTNFANKAVDKDVEDPANNTIKAGKNHAPSVGGGAILATYLVELLSKGTTHGVSLLKETNKMALKGFKSIIKSSPPLEAKMNETVNIAKTGWDGYSSEQAMNEVLSPRVDGNSMARAAMNNELKKQIAQAYEARLEGLEKGVDVREVDNIFLDKASQLYGVDAKTSPALQKNLNDLLVSSDAALANAPEDKKAEIKKITQDSLKLFYGQAAGHESLLSDPKFAQNATRLKALDTALETEMTAAYDERLKNISNGMDVRMADDAFNNRMKKAYGVSDDDVNFDQKIKDALINQDKQRKDVVYPSYPEQLKDNIKELKQGFANKSELFEIVSESAAQQALLNKEPSPNPFEDSMRLNNIKKNLEDFSSSEKNKEIISKLGEHMNQMSKMVTQFLTKVFTGRNGPSGP